MSKKDSPAENSAAPDAKADHLWFKDAIIYELHVKAFCDSDGNGIGDFAGLASKLDYLQDLGVTALWLLPFFPSPLRDDGYDAADYTSVHPDYGAMRDLKMFLREAKRRGPAGHHRAGAQPHLGPASLVPARPPRQAGQRPPQFLRVERHARPLCRRPHHLPGLRDVQLGLGPGGQGPITGIGSTRTSRT